MQWCKCMYHNCGLSSGVRWIYVHIVCNCKYNIIVYHALFVLHYLIYTRRIIARIMIIVIIMSSSSLSFLAAAGAASSVSARTMSRVPAQAVVSYWIYVHSVHCFRAHFAPQNTRHVVQKVVMPFQSAPKSFPQWVYFASYWRSKHLQCHNLRLR